MSDGEPRRMTDPRASAANRFYHVGIATDCGSLAKPSYTPSTFHLPLLWICIPTSGTLGLLNSLKLAFRLTKLLLKQRIGSRMPSFGLLGKAAPPVGSVSV